MRRLWIADVHANLPAFEAVLAAAGQVDEVIFLGDVLGFGPHPAACVDLLRSLSPRAVLGNHDAAILARRDDPAAPGPPGDWDPWTLRRLDEEQLAFLATLPASLALTVCGTSAEALHRLPGAPYLHPAMPDAVLAELVGDLPAATVLCGHCHHALDREVDGRRLVCLPPVGQPRNGDPRAGYAIECDEGLRFHYAAYDVERTVADTQRIGLPEPFCGRWLSFVRTGFDAEWSRPYRPEGAREVTGD